MSSNAEPAEAITRLTSDQVTVPNTPVSIYQALYQRKMTWKFKDTPVSRESLDRMLEAAVWAPNHRLTEPWRFFVLEKGSPLRRKVAELAYEFVLEHSNLPTRALAARHKVLDPPVVIYVYCVPGPSDEATRENYAAVCCAVQNILLAGVAEGLAVAWDTGGPTRHPQLKEALEAAPDWTLAAMLSIGVPAETRVSHRAPAATFVRWFGTDQGLAPPEEGAV